MAAEPVYRLIAEDLRWRIESGTIGQDGRLPTEMDLMEQFSASRTMVRNAIRLLTAWGLAETRPGQGTFALRAIAPFVTTFTQDPRAGHEGRVYTREIKASEQEPTNSPPRVEIQPADGAVALMLRITEGDSVVSRHQQRFIGNVAWSLQTTFYPMTLVTERGATRLLRAEDIPEGTVAYLARELGVIQAGYRDLIAMRMADQGETEFFRLRRDGGALVFEISRVAYAEDGGPIRLTVTAYPADRNVFCVDTGKVPPAGSDGDEL